MAEAAPPRKTSRADRERIAERLADRLATDRLPDLTRDKTQAALATLRDAGLSLQSVNHHRAALRAFSRWSWKDGRTRDDALVALSGYNAREDRRHDRRTLSVEELTRLVRAAQEGPTYRKMTGPTRALCDRLAVATGLWFSELDSIAHEAAAFPLPDKGAVMLRIDLEAAGIDYRDASGSCSTSMPCVASVPPWPTPPESRPESCNAS